MNLRLIPLALLLSSPVYAQQRTIDLSDQQIEGIIQAGAACENRTPYACSRLLIYVHDLLRKAQEPKPPPAKE